MLVYFHKGFIMEGEASFKERKHFWSKPEYNRFKIHLSTGIHGICDDSELDATVERLTEEQLNSGGWGDKFHGWHRVLTPEEAIELANREQWDYIPTCALTTKTLDDWTVEQAAKKLTGKQFAQYCKDYGIVINL